MEETFAPDSTTQSLLQGNMTEQASSSKDDHSSESVHISTPKLADWSDSQEDNHDASNVARIPTTKLVDAERTISAVPSVASFILSDNNSVISAQEISQRREALRVFSSAQSVASSSIGRSTTTLPTMPLPGIANMAAVVNNNVGISYELTPFSSTLSGLTPLCRICQCPSDATNTLITPCRCDGSLKHIHPACLLKWIDVCTRKRRRIGKAAYCELCGYIYRRHKHIKYRDWKWPNIAVRDRVLHLIFAISLVIMIGCAIATVLCFITDSGQYRRHDALGADLTKEEIITICCGITFFVSFFVSMSAEIKAKKTIHQIMRKCLRHNTVWTIENYNVACDSEYRRALNQSRLGTTKAMK